MGDPIRETWRTHQRRESHHRGSIMPALEQNGIAPPETLRRGIRGTWFDEEDEPRT
jgi:hypothetical protein